MKTGEANDVGGPFGKQRYSHLPTQVSPASLKLSKKRSLRVAFFAAAKNTVIGICWKELFRISLRSLLEKSENW